MSVPGEFQSISKISDMTEGVEIKGYSKLKNIESTPFSKVFAALHNATNNLVSLKFIESTFVKDPVKITQFINENVAAGRLDHKNIAKVFESGKLGTLDYVSMEFLNGRDLKQIMGNVKVLNPYLASEIILRVALALQFANDHALIHKGIRLENIVIIDISKDIKLQGFGLAHGVRSDNPEYQQILMDSLHYVSPEQAAEKAIDFRSDIYSLGVCYYYLVTGRFPFVADTPEELINLHTNSEILKPSKVRFELNENIENTILKMLEKKPEDRYSSYTSLIDELATILGIDDISTYIAQAEHAEEAIAVDAAFSMDSMLDVAPQMIETKKLIEVDESEIEEIDDAEIEEIEDIDEIEEINQEPQAPLRMAPKKLRPGKKTEISRDHKRRPTHAVKKAPKTSRYNDAERPADRPRRKRRPEDDEMSQRKQLKKKPTQKQHKGMKPPTNKLKTNGAEHAKPQTPPAKVQPAPKPIAAPPLIPIKEPTNEPEAVEPTPVVPQKSVEKPTTSLNKNKTYSTESLESKTSSGKISKAPKVPSDGGNKIGLNRGALQLDSSSKLSNLDPKDEKKPEDEDIADISEIEIITEEDEFDDRIK